LLAGCGGGTSGGATGGTSSGTTGGTSGASNEQGASTQAPAGANIAEHIDIIINETEITLLNPTSTAGTAASSWVYVMIQDRLMDEPSVGVFTPQLATEWHTDDYQHFTFKLREDVYFHNGDHFTADDVIWTIEYAKSDPSINTYSRFRTIDTVKALDPYTLEITLSTVYYDFYDELSAYTAGILSQRAYNENPNNPSWGQIGTGPFKVTAFSSNDYCTIERNENYWGDPPPTKSLTFWTIPEMSTRMVRLKNKEAQLSFLMSPEDMDVLSVDPDFQVFPQRIIEPTSLSFNDQGDEIVTDINFRLAIAHALNTEEIAIVAQGNWGLAPTDGNPWGPDTQYYLPGLPKREYDPELAKEYLAKSPYNGEVLSLVTSTSPHHVKAIEIVQLQLEKIGIKVDPLVLDHAGFVEMHRWDPTSTRQIHIFATATNKTVSRNFSSLTSTSTNRFNCADPLVYDLAARYTVTVDEETRIAIAHQLQEDFLYGKLPTIPLFWRLMGIAAVKGIGGMKLYANQYEHDLRGIYWNLDETPERLRR
jgi:peptide/nickel transport system substrate-binding protein